MHGPTVDNKGIICSSSKCSLGKRKLKRPPKQYRRIYFVQNLTGLYFFQSSLLLMYFQRKWKSFQYHYTGTFCRKALCRSTKLINLSRCDKSHIFREQSTALYYRFYFHNETSFLKTQM